MSRFVIDASVGIKWFIPEVHSDIARKILYAGNELHTSEFFFIECANILWKKVQRKEIANSDVSTILDELVKLPLNIHRITPNLPLALQIALETGRTAYDSLYIALAKQIDGIMLTADERLVNAVANKEYAKHCQSLISTNTTSDA
jgi:predicted nucleic acid-binding protein